MNAQKILIDDIAKQITDYLRSGKISSRIRIVRIMNKNLSPVPEVAECTPVILFFPNHAEADAFIAMVKEVKPNMEERKL